MDKCVAQEEEDPFPLEEGQNNGEEISCFSCLFLISPYILHGKLLFTQKEKFQLHRKD